MANAKCIMMNLSLLNLIEPTSGDRQAKCKMMILSLLNSEPLIYSNYNKPWGQSHKSYKMIYEASVHIFLILEEQKKYDEFYYSLLCL